MMKLRTSIFLICIFQSSLILAKDFQFFYQVRKGDRFESILGQFIKRLSKIRPKDITVYRTYELNRDVRNWKDLAVGSRIELFIEESKANSAKIERYIETEKDGFELYPNLPKHIAMKIYYKASNDSWSNDRAGVITEAILGAPVGVGFEIAFHQYPPKKYPLRYSAIFEYSMISDPAPFELGNLFKIGGKVAKYQIYKYTTPFLYAGYHSISTIGFDGVDLNPLSAKSVWVGLGSEFNYKWKKMEFIFTAYFYKALSTSSSYETGTVVLDHSGSQIGFELEANLVKTFFGKRRRLFLNLGFDKIGFSGDEELKNTALNAKFGLYF